MSERTKHEIICQHKYNGWSAESIAKKLDLEVDAVKAVIKEDAKKE